MKKINNKGIILAGGLATRLMPITKVVSKQLLPIFDKPMIYYPLDILLKSNIREIAIIVNPIYKSQFINLLGDGSKFGCQFTYIDQKKPQGIAESYILCNKFLGNSKSVLILGDNLFYGSNFTESVNHALKKNIGSTIFAYEVNNPERYGNIQIDKNNKVKNILEKPKKPKTNFAITGIYIFDNLAKEKVKNIKPSKRGELEITSLLKKYLKNNTLEYTLLDRGIAWLDTGTSESFNDANNFVRAIQKRQGLIIGCLEETALNNGWISIGQIKKNQKELNNSEYGNYLKKLISLRNK